MRGAKKALSILITVIMLMQLVPVMAAGMTITDLTWGEGSCYGAPQFTADKEGQ